MNNAISVDVDARSRRNFFAKAGAFLAAAGVAPSFLKAQTFTSDVDILNYALRLERLEASFYTIALSKFAPTDFAASNFAKNLTATQVANAYTYIQTIQQQELSHVNQITAAITGMGGTPVPEDCYGFQPYGNDNKTFVSPDSFISAAMNIENTGVSAYDGAISLVQSAALRTTAATIATVEGRHAAYLNFLNGVIPFPSAYDTAGTAASVTAALTPYFAPCSSFPVTVVVGPQNVITSSNTLQLNSNGTMSAGGGQYPIIYYVWETILGGHATVTNANSPNPTVTFLGGPGIYNFSLVVVDSAGETGSAQLKATYTGT
jgi:Ferritin-like domain